MRIEIRVSGNVPEEVPALLRKRLEFALGRFSPRIQRVRASLKDLNGPRGGVDKQCLVDVRLRHERRPIVIEDVDADPMVASGRAAERAGRAVARTVETTQDSSYYLG